jgi:3-oxoadipate enol-lactonase
MPTIQADDGCQLNVMVEGRESAPVLMLSNSLGTNLHMWDDQAPEFAKHFRLVRYDRRGHGKSDVPNGPYSMERFGRDVISILDALEIKKTNWCGLSMGGMVGQWLGANAPDRVDKLILSNTNYNYADKAPWNDRIKFVKEKGLAELVDPNMERWFTKEFRARAPQTIARMKEIFLTTKTPGYIACCEAIRDMNFTASNPKVASPTLVIVGKQDPATPPSAGEAIAQQIKGAKLAALDAAHISNMEQPKLYAETVLNFLNQRRTPWTRRSAMKRAWPGAARCWAMPGSTAPMRARHRSTRSSRTSSRAAPGARSGRGPTTTSARAASW